MPAATTLKPIRVIPVIRGQGKRRTTPVTIPINPNPPPFEDDLPPQIRQLADSIGERNARIVWQWRQRLGSVPSSPELLVYNWLTSNKVNFTYQQNNYGGRSFKGGMVNDFIIQVGGGVLVWEVQGEYWHGSKAIGRTDEAQARRLLLGNVQGQRCVGFVFLWEHDVYSNVATVCRDAMRGRGLRDA